MTLTRLVVSVPLVNEGVRFGELKWDDVVSHCRSPLSGGAGIMLRVDKVEALELARFAVSTLQEPDASPPDAWDELLAKADEVKAWLSDLIEQA